MRMKEKAQPAVASRVNLDEIPWETARYPDEDFDRGAYRDIGGALGSRTIGANVHRLSSGQENAKYHAHEFEEELLAIIDARKPKQMVIDFTGVTQCSTAVINSLLTARKAVIKEGGELRLCGMKDTVRAAYRILNLEGRIFVILETRDEALGSFK